ncbi:MAG: WecB/TagA/CpsF family glycosyltransferase [Oscillospiraceae bacterium]|nr:WecB/TagA/CpsF family glycosyltransferase [Oscillospiraceae bacterium]MCL2227707.1 WecB/TagA/CpsF family glycosyltransferase [Oscillospiraceae bacterium]
MRIDVLGVGFDDISIEQATLRALEIMGGEERAYAVTPNPEIVWQSCKNTALRDALNSAELVLPDGIGIVLGAKILGTPLLGGRVPGIDFATALFEKMAESNGKVFLLGAKPGVAVKAGANLAKKHPGLIVCGAADGYFTDGAAIVSKINAAKPDLLLACLGAPKQELWMAENRDNLGAPLCAGLGGSLDIFAENVKRAPVFFQRLGLEWLYRILKEPWRLKRSLSLPLFVFAVIFMRLKGKAGRM